MLVIAGTTAVGKTSLSLELAKRLGGEIISADSVQVHLPPVFVLTLISFSFFSFDLPRSSFSSSSSSSSLP